MRKVLLKSISFAAACKAENIALQTIEYKKQQQYDIKIVVSLSEHSVALGILKCAEHTRDLKINLINKI